MTAPSESRLRRPVLVTIVVVLVYVGGFASVGIGVLVMLSRYDVAPDAVLSVSLLGAGLILFGLLAVAVAAGLGRGSSLSRLLVSIYAVIQLVLQTLTILTTDAWDWWSLVDIVIEIVVLAVLWAPPTSRYFRRPLTDVSAA